MTDDIGAMRKELAELRIKGHALRIADNYVVALRIGGDSVVFWRKGKAGYTTNLDDAEIFTEAQAWSTHRNRPHEDIPMPYADAVAMATRQVSQEHFHRWLRDHPMPVETP